MPPHPLTNLEMQKYYQNDPRFNEVYSRDNLPKIKDGANVINLDEYSDIETHSIALHALNNNGIMLFILIVLELNIKTNILRIQAYDLIYNVWILLYWIY